MPIIPNEIIITINTSIPGYQKIKYTPSMTIKNISNNDNTIRKHTYNDIWVKIVIKTRDVKISLNNRKYKRIKWIIKLNYFRWQLKNKLDLKGKTNYIRIINDFWAKIIWNGKLSILKRGGKL